MSETMEDTSEEIDVTPSSLSPILKLDKLQIKSILRLYEAAGDDTSLPRYAALHLLLADLLERLEFLKPSQRTAILDQYAYAIETNLPQWDTLAFADGNWCVWTGHTGWYDLTTGDTVAELPLPPVETIGYNLVVLYQRAIAQIKKRQANAEKHTAGSMDEPRDFRDGPPNPVP